MFMVRNVADMRPIYTYLMTINREIQQYIKRTWIMRGIEDDM